MKYAVCYEHVITKMGTTEIEAESEDEALEKFQQMADNSEVSEAEEDLDEETYEVKEVF